MKKKIILSCVFVIIVVIATITISKKEIKLSKKEFSEYFVKTDSIALEENRNSFIGSMISFTLLKDRIYVGSSNFKIRVFNKYGKYLFSFGGPGNGPGEFQFITEMFTVGDKIAVYDAMDRKVSFFDSDGKYIHSAHSNYLNILNILQSENGYIIYVPNTMDYNYNLVEVDTNFRKVREISQGNSKYTGFSKANIFYGNVERIGNEIFEFNSYSDGLLSKIDFISGNVKKISFPYNDFFNISGTLEHKTIKNENDYKKYSQAFTKVMKCFFIDERFVFTLLGRTIGDIPKLEAYLFDFKTDNIYLLTNDMLMTKHINKKYYHVAYETNTTNNKFEIGKLMLNEYEFKEQKN